YSGENRRLFIAPLGKNDEKCDNTYSKNKQKESRLQQCRFDLQNKKLKERTQYVPFQIAWQAQEKQKYAP
ncbi:MAG: hypothetical protein J6R63_04145, partial [Kiritimatiellae bacterium]|nr:hypothetical protein [Kiritimatiellia bacterium]